MQGRWEGLRRGAFLSCEPAGRIQIDACAARYSKYKITKRRKQEQEGKVNDVYDKTEKDERT